MAISLSGINDNRIAQFAARFELQEDGSCLYFHPGGHGGLPCSESEANAMIAEFSATQNRSMRSGIYWAIGCGLVLGLLEASQTLVFDRWMQYALILMPFPYILLAWRQASLQPLRHLEGRFPAAPPRSGTEARNSRLAALPPGLFVSMLACDALLAWYAMDTGWETDSALIVGATLLMASAWLLARRAQAYR
ncbi:MAG: hypothetical protein PHH47_02495 [Gallionella sp.]|nr:hypothetical protein [Gallionella sp.]MDD4946067.1 hypothetical protein [Gallionella sp.]MDD5612991.1 hypothetical protein [Gallionella sp.]